MACSHTQPFDLCAEALQRSRIIDAPLHRLRPDADQPRRHFDPVSLDALARSMAVVGQLQPIGVREAGAQWVIVYGERRWRAAKLLGWSSLLARVYQPLGAVTLVLQATENMHRDELTLGEYATTVLRLIEAGMPVAALARSLGQPEGWVATMLRIARDPVARGLIDAGRLQSAGAWDRFCALDAAARRIVLESTEPITGDRCALAQEQATHAPAARRRRHVVAAPVQQQRNDGEGSLPMISGSPSTSLEPGGTAGAFFPLRIPEDLCRRLVPDHAATLDHYLARSDPPGNAGGALHDVEADLQHALLARVRAFLEVHHG
ncbi:ParB/RepB/Spo0J family partition protein [Thiomonas intermedia]|uniref:ParB/RepB/Spo0J family partition protein n=1 Tax=Thiomonas intermedia TaxID=926 RepID=UPI0014738EAF|nr:ParB/RepB/Spo0J family partition protein [Thiomonas intermedia]